MIARIKKNDNVQIISGKDKGLQGIVLQVLPEKNKVLVKGGAIIVKHHKPRRKNEPGMKKSTESFINMSRVMPVCPACKKPCRINSTEGREHGQKIRTCHKCKESF